MTLRRIAAGLARAVALAALLGALAGCAALSSLSAASEPFDAFALTPLAGAGGAGGTRHVVVELPTTSGAIATDRILVKPNRLQAAYLPAARWVEPAPVLIQTLLVQSMQASGAFRLVGRTALGLYPDTTLVTEIRAFEAEPGPPGGPPYTVRVALTLALVRETDGAILATRNLEASAPAASVDPLVVAAAFDAATRSVLREAVAWAAADDAGRHAGDRADAVREPIPQHWARDPGLDDGLRIGASGGGCGAGQDARDPVRRADGGAVWTIAVVAT